MTIKRILALYLILLVIGIGIAQCVLLQNLGNSLSFDPVSEANAIHAGESYATRGFLQHMGLPNVYYGKLFPLIGLKRGCMKCISLFPYHSSLIRDVGGQCNQMIYTHYPPGADYMVGLMTALVGPGQVKIYRWLPVAFGILCIGFFTWILFLVFGPVVSSIALTVFVAAPAFTNMMHGLHHQSYGFSLLLVQMALLMLIFSRKPKPILWVILGAVGFFQGWVSFDYFFVVSLSAIPFWLKQGEIAPRKKLMLAVMIPTLGFSLAHLMHFIQVAIHYGSFWNAVMELGGIGIGVAYGAGIDPVIKLLHSLYGYLGIWLPSAYGLGYWVVIGILLVMVVPKYLGKRATLWQIKIGQYQLQVKRVEPKRIILILFWAILVSMLWMIIMLNHSSAHYSYHSRHFFLAYFFAVIMILKSFRIKLNYNDEAKA